MAHTAPSIEQASGRATKVVDPETDRADAKHKGSAEGKEGMLPRKQIAQQDETVAGETRIG